MDQKKLKELQGLAEQKGFILDLMEEGEQYDQEGKFVLEGADDDVDEDFLYFKTEDGVHRFLEAIPDAPIDWPKRAANDEEEF